MQRDAARCAPRAAVNDESAVAEARREVSAVLRRRRSAVSGRCSTYRTSAPWTSKTCWRCDLAALVDCPAVRGAWDEADALSMHQWIGLRSIVMYADDGDDGRLAWHALSARDGDRYDPQRVALRVAAWIVRQTLPPSVVQDIAAGRLARLGRRHERHG